jgi:two-component sensor histidine kinase
MIPTQEMADHMKADVRKSKVRPARLTLLLREAGYRIKNSLQLVASVLDLQARQNVGGPALREALAQASRRVRAVAQVHERLQHSSSGVEISTYLRDLYADMSRSLALPVSRPIEMKVANLELPAERTVALGLIVTELVTNALKYGQRINGSGRVRVLLTTLPGGTLLRLLVADDGPGLPDNPYRTFDSGFGMLLVHRLVHRLAGRLEDGRPPGMRTTLHLAPMAAQRGAKEGIAIQGGAPCV